MARASATSSLAEEEVVEATLVFAAEDGGMSFPCAVPVGTPQGVWWLTVIVESEQIVGCVADESSDEVGTTACSAVQELDVAGLENGEYSARVVIADQDPDLR